MEINWNERDPIYRQLHDRLVEMILEGTYRNGDLLPSVRQISADHRINPITISKAFQLLVDEGVVEKKRGLGMYVMMGATEKLAQECTSDEGFSVIQFRDASEIGRNLCIEILEYFDKIGFTRRDGNSRFLRTEKENIFGN